MFDISIITINWIDKDNGAGVASSDDAINVFPVIKGLKRNYWRSVNFVIKSFVWYISVVNVVRRCLAFNSFTRVIFACVGNRETNNIGII